MSMEVWRCIWVWNGYLCMSVAGQEYEAETKEAEEVKYKLDSVLPIAA